MKTTVEIPEKLFRQAKALAAYEGISLRDFFLRGLHLAIQSSSIRASRNRATFPLVRSASSNTRLSDEQVYEALDSDEDLT